MFKLNTGVMDTDAIEPVHHPFGLSERFVFNILRMARGRHCLGGAIMTSSTAMGAAVLYAWDANDLTTPLYESDTNATRDSAGPANKFSTPVVTNGKVYVATHGEVDVYGLFNGEPTAAPPAITPNGGTFSASQSVTALHHDCIRGDFLYAGWYYSNAGVDALCWPDHDQHGYHHQGNCERTRIYPEQRQQCHFHVYLPDAALTFTPAGGTYPNAQSVTHRGYGHQRKDLLHHRRLDSVGFLDPVFGTDCGRSFRNHQGDRHRSQPAEQ